MNIVRGGLLIAALVYPFVAEKIAKPHGPVVPAFFYAMAGVAAVVTLVALIVRAKTPALTEADIKDKAKVVRWRAMHIITYALALSVVLDGFVSRVVAVTVRQVLPFYVVGVLLLLVFSPRVSDQANAA